MKISYVIPVLNEEDSLQILYNEIIRYNPVRSNHVLSAQDIPLFDDYEMIFIDDGSTDKSFSILASIAEKDRCVKIVSFRRNFGKSAALHVGFALAGGDYVFTLDADLQDNPAEIPNFIMKMDQGYDLVSGWKEKRQDPIYKTLPSKLFNYITSRAFSLYIKDFNCGYKLYRKSVVKELNIYGEMHRYIPALAHSLGYKVGEIPVDHRKRQYGVSKYGFERYMRGFFDLLTVKMVTKYSKSPLYLFGRIGFIAVLSGTFLTGYLTCLKLFLGHPLTNRPLLSLGVLLILAGLQFISMGLISELIINKSDTNVNTQISIKDLINIDKNPVGQIPSIDKDFSEL